MNCYIMHFKTFEIAKETVSFVLFPNAPINILLENWCSYRIAKNNILTSLPSSLENIAYDPNCHPIRIFLFCSHK